MFILEVEGEMTYCYSGMKCAIGADWFAYWESLADEYGLHELDWRYTNESHFWRAWLKVF
jgi:hypothetical protein